MMGVENHITEDEWTKVEEHSLNFFQTWINFYGQHWVKHYVHVIVVGHLLNHMRKYGNLSKYSQKEWEVLNALITLFFFWCMNKGGKNSGDTYTKLKSKLTPIGRPIHRCLQWVCNLVPEDLWDNNFEILCHKKNYIDNDKHYYI